MRSETAFEVQRVLLGWLPAWLDKRLLTRLVIIGGVLSMAVVVPLGLSPHKYVLLAGAMLGLCVVLLFDATPPLGLLALLVTALIVPSPSLPGGVNLAVLLLGLLIGLWLADMVIRKHRIGLYTSRTVRPLLVFVGVTVLSFVLGQLPWFGGTPRAPMDSQLGGLAIFLMSAGAYLLVAHQVREVRWLAWMTWTFLSLSAFFIAGWIVPGVGSITGHLFQLGATSNSMFWVWLVALALSQAVFNRTLHPAARLALMFLTLATVYVAYVINGDWKSGYLPVFVVIAVIIALRSWRLGLLMAVVGPLAAIFLSSQAISTDEYSYSTRLDAWIIVLKMIKVNPLFGFGPANYYWYTPLFPIRGWHVKFNSHNQYIDIIAQIGILGLACFVWFAAEVGMLGWRLRNVAASGFEQAYVMGALAGLVGTLAAGMLVDWFLPFVYNIGFSGFRTSMLPWLFLGGLVSIERVVRARYEVGTTTEPSLVGEAVHG